VIMSYLHNWLWDFAIEARNPQLDDPERPIGQRNSALSSMRAAHYVEGWTAGYVAEGSKGLRDRHRFAAIQLVLSLVLYFALYVKGLSTKADFGAPAIPTLCLILVLMMLGCLTLSALAFFCDRFRFPLLAVIGLYMAICSIFPQSDNFYPSTERTQKQNAQTKPSSPRDTCPSSAGRPIVVVAASGGGIQSAAWTALVLSGLKEDMQDLGNDFDCSIKVISSVSGGSVGAMYFADAYNSGVLPKVAVPLEKYGPVANAEASSLDQITWGLVYQDVPWSVLPFAKGISFSPVSLFSGQTLTNDRGSALEHAWQLNDSLQRATLSRWTDDAANSRRPALIFNATIVETGERLLLSTDASFSEQQSRDPSIGKRHFGGLYPDRDLQVTTAARLSATFPYVSPAGQIWRRHVSAEDYHIVDGGYYDNYGVVSLLDWLDTNLQMPGPKPSKVIVVQIRGFRTRPPLSPVRHRGFIFQALQPLQTLLHVRETGQFSHNQIDMELAQRPNVYSVPVLAVDFEFMATDEEGEAIEPPLSWHLTPKDKQVLKSEWDSERVRAIREKFKGFFPK
jgi:predicted acylesterase/phospholipase RssA